MCGIFAVVNDKSGNAAQTIRQGLKRLEYRGYDSWGIAVQTDNRIDLIKYVGEIDKTAKNIKNLPASNIGIGHTRWATTGAVTQINAHPHFSTDKSFVLAQNGIVENYEELKKELALKKYRFITQTDTEVIVRLIEDKLTNKGDLLAAVRDTFLKLKGRNTIIILTKTGQIIAARNGSPLVIGLNQKSDEIFLSSDTLSFAPFAEKIVVIDNGKLINCVNGQIKVSDIKSGMENDYKIEDINIKNDKVDKEGYKHFMLKEIHEAPLVINQLLKQDSQSYNQLATAIRKAKNVYAIGSGTAGVAAAQIAFYLREHAGIKAVGLIGADAREYFDLIGKNDLIIVASQSGETADVLEVLEFVKKKGVKIASFVNMPGSMITRMSDYKFMAQSGPEICVLSTKVFVAQIAWGYLIAKVTAGKSEEGRDNLSHLSNQISRYLEKNTPKVEELADYLLKAHDIFLMGKYQNFQIVNEGMIKLVEATYKHAHAIPAGDLKHYAITLMEPGVPVIVVSSNDQVKSDIFNSIFEVKARGAQVVGISPEFDEKFDFHLKVPDTGETSAIANIIPLQLLAYYIGLKLGNSIDKPRNIAKSVTVK